MAQGNLSTNYLLGGTRRSVGIVSRQVAARRKKWKRRSEQDRPPGAKVKYRTTYRVRGRTAEGRLTFFKTRTKLPITTIKRLMARGNLTADRITI